MAGVDGQIEVAPEVFDGFVDVESVCCQLFQDIFVGWTAKGTVKNSLSGGVLLSEIDVEIQ